MMYDIRNLVVAESVRQMLSANYGQTLCESLTIPLNEKDPIEKELYAELDKQYKYSDAIVRWFRSDRKSGMSDVELKVTYIDCLHAIYDLLEDYDHYVDELKKTKRLGKVSIPMGNGRTRDIDPVKDFPTIRRLDGVASLVRTLGDMVHSNVKIDSPVAKYQITADDLSNIGILGSSENVVVWFTRTFESTNKLVFQLWQNEETMDRGDAYGDKYSQSPYCTHAKKHWDSYAEDFHDYMQYWYLEKIRGVSYPTGDLSSPGVATAFNAMKGRGPELIIAMNDSGNDFLDDNDRSFDLRFSQLRNGLGDEVEFLSNTLFEVRYNGSVGLKYREGRWKAYGYSGDDCLVLPAISATNDDKTLSVKSITISDPACTTLPALPAQYTVTPETHISIDCKHIKDLINLPDIGDGKYVLGDTLLLPECDSLRVEQVANDSRIDAFGFLTAYANVTRKSSSTAILDRRRDTDLLWCYLAKRIVAHCGFLVSDGLLSEMPDRFRRLFVEGARSSPYFIGDRYVVYTKNSKTAIEQVVHDLKTNHPSTTSMALKFNLSDSLWLKAINVLNGLGRSRLAKIASTVCPSLSFSKEYFPSLSVSSADMFRAVIGYTRFLAETHSETDHAIVMGLCDTLCDDDKVMDPACHHLFDLSLFYNPVVDLAPDCHETLLELAEGRPTSRTDYLSILNGQETEGYQIDW